MKSAHHTIGDPDLAVFTATDAKSLRKMKVSPLCRAFLYSDADRRRRIRICFLFGLVAIHSLNRFSGCVYDHAGRTLTLLGDSDRARNHSRFHSAVRLAD